MLFLEAYQKLRVIQPQVKYALLQASIMAHTQDSILFLICAYECASKPTMKKVEGIHNIFIKPPASSSTGFGTFEEDDLFTINLTQPCIKSSTTLVNQMTQPSTQSCLALFNEVTNQRTGLAHQGLLDLALQKTLAIYSGNASSSVKPTQITRELARMKRALAPYWGNDLPRLGFPARDHIITFPYTYTLDLATASSNQGVEQFRPASNSRFNRFLRRLRRAR